MSRKKNQKLKFIDLFAGLGGFHLALSSLGCECVFASELKEDLRKLYKENYDMECYGDLTKIPVSDIPEHDILCGGFPCQPFSKAGFRQGFQDEKDRGNLFFRILDIVKYHTPKYIFLENVSNLKGHDGGNTWKVIKESLESAGYYVDAKILSPHKYGIPQHRQRIYIVGIRSDVYPKSAFKWPEPLNAACSIMDVIETEEVSNHKEIRPEIQSIFNIWQEFIDELVKHNEPIPSFPIWAMEFGATYDYEGLAPSFQSIDALRGKRGHLGQTIDGESHEECLRMLPNYAQRDGSKEFPTWKKHFIKMNRDLYDRNKEWIDPWLEKVKGLDNSYLKLEWNCGRNCDPTIIDKLVQLRASGIRVKRNDYAPALNLCTTQIPILPWLGRSMSIKELSRLQGMETIVDKALSKDSPITLGRLSAAFGNAVNVNVVKMIGENLIKG